MKIKWMIANQARRKYAPKINSNYFMLILRNYFEEDKHYYRGGGIRLCRFYVNVKIVSEIKKIYKKYYSKVGRPRKKPLNKKKISEYRKKIKSKEYLDNMADEAARRMMEKGVFGEI